MASFCCVSVTSGGSFAYLILFSEISSTKTDMNQECDASRHPPRSALLPGITKLSLPDSPTTYH